MTISISTTWIFLGGIAATLLCGGALFLVVVWLDRLGPWQEAGQHWETSARVSTVRATARAAASHRLSSRRVPRPLDVRVYALLRELRKTRRLPSWEDVETDSLWHAGWHSWARLTTHPGDGRTAQAPDASPCRSSERWQVATDSSLAHPRPPAWGELPSRLTGTCHCADHPHRGLARSPLGRHGRPEKHV